MRANGNGLPEVCVQNLLKTIRGEVPYDRIKGIDRTLIDRPSKTAGPMLLSDAEFVVKTYEPRVRLNSAELAALIAENGGFRLTADIDTATAQRRKTT